MNILNALKNLFGKKPNQDETKQEESKELSHTQLADEATQTVEETTEVVISQEVEVVEVEISVIEEVKIEEPSNIEKKAEKKAEKKVKSSKTETQPKKADAKTKNSKSEIEPKKSDKPKPQKPKKSK